MYGGAAVESNRNQNPNNHHMNSASPIPQQWWEQDGQGQGRPVGPDPNGYSHGGRPGMSAMDAAAAASSRMNGVGMGNGNAMSPPQTPSNGIGNAPPPPPQRQPSSNGLIRLTLKKPMGIVFEPMEDPHNPSQQRGVRICDLPRTGAAALSGVLEVGDELLSLNSKTMSRLTFDEIMDFIIDADAENVDLLFRRPKKDRSAAGKISDATKAKNSAVKWDENVTNTMSGTVDTNDDTTLEDDTLDSTNHKRSPQRKGHHNHRDEESLYSGDETFYTEQTSVYTEDTRQNKSRGKNRRRRYESESFLDLLIDTVCAPMIGGRDGKGGDDSDDDMTFNSMDEDTYASGDESYTYLEEKKKKWQESRKKRSEREKKSLEEDKKKNKKTQEKTRSPRSPSKRSVKEKQYEPENVPPYDRQPSEPSNDHYGRNQNNTTNYGHGAQNPVPYSEHKQPEILGVPDMNIQPHPQAMHPSAPPSPRRNMVMDTGMGMNMGMNIMPSKTPSPTRHRQRQKSSSPRKNGSQRVRTENPQNPLNVSGEPDPKMPFKEITYDDQVEEQVSVMESVGGPSLLLENLRNAQQIQRTVEPDIIAKYGKDFKPDLGLTREESIQMNPDRFYKFAVKKILENNEPEKVRLMDKLFDKYYGREEHLIRKLGARYAASNPSESMDNVKSTSSDGAYDGFKAFGGGDFSNSESADKPNTPSFSDGDGWQSRDMPAFEPSATSDMPGPSNDSEMYGEFTGNMVSNEKNHDGHDGHDGRHEHDEEDDHSSYTESDYESLDGTSPEVIAQVSELLNYVYGKTTVAGQIDRVSTIMRAYEGREAILLELLETKALLKANNEKGSLDELPDSLKDNPGLQQNPSGAEVRVEKSNLMMSPISHATNPSTQAPVSESRPQQTQPKSPDSISPMKESVADINPFNIDNRNQQAPTYSTDKKKKKGFFGRFKKKKAGKGGEFPTNEGSRKNRRNSGALLGGE